MRLVLSGGDPRASAFVATALGRGGHVVDQVRDYADAVTACGTACDGAVFCPGALDDGVQQAVSALRAQLPELAIIIVATAASCDEIGALLEAGADDVIDSPAGSGLLLARLTAVVRRAAGHALPDIRVGAVVVRLRNRDCLAGGQAVALTEMEYRLLEALALRRGQPVPRSSLLELLYDAHSEPFPKSIDLFVHNIRRKLTPTRCSRYLETLAGGFALRDAGPAAAAPVS